MNANQKRALSFTVAAVGVAAVILVLGQRRRAGSDALAAAGEVVSSRPLPESPEKVAEAFAAAWSTFRYGDALRLSTGATRTRVLGAMQKESRLDDEEKLLADRVRQTVRGLKIHLDVAQIDQVGTREVRVRGRTVATDGENELVRDQSFDLVWDGGWRVTSWDPGRAAQPTPLSSKPPPPSGP